MKKYNCILIAVLVYGLLFLEMAIGDVPQVQWEKIFVRSGSRETGRSVQQTSDGGYIIAGRIDYVPPSVTKVYLLKADSVGNAEWEKFPGSQGHGHSVKQTSDGGYIITGCGGGVYLLKTDSAGSMQWDRKFGTSIDRGLCVNFTNDGGYIVVGDTDYGPGSQGVYLIKTNSAGNMQWQKTFGGSCVDEGHSVQQTSDGGYIIAGRSCSSFGAGNHDVYLIKTNSYGNMQWQRTFGGASYDDAYSVQQTVDQGYIITGSSYSYGSGIEECYLVKTDSTGSLQWQRTFEGPRGYSVQQTTDGGYIITGCKSGYIIVGGPGRTLKTDSVGNLLWEMPIGGYSIQQTSDGGYIIVGTTIPDPYDIWHMFLVKLAREIVGELNGFVLNQVTGQPIVDANVSVPGWKVVHTNEFGEFRFSELPVGQTTVSVSKSGYFPSTREVTISNNSTTSVLIELVAALEPSPPERLEYPELNLPTEPNKLVFITHGWKNNQDDFDNIWIPFRNTIQAKIDERSDANEWVVLVYPWIECSNTSLTECYNYAMEIGQACGAWIANKHYKHVHLIASSAGSALIAMAAEWIKSESSSTEVHVTFLDPYTPWKAKSYYGLSADWAENYCTSTAGPIDIWTHQKLPNAHNVEVQLLDPNYPYTDLISGHFWPRILYQRTVLAPQGTIPGARHNGIDYGFCRSLEGEGWPDSQLLPVGNDPIVLGNGTSAQLVEPTGREDPTIDISSHSYILSETGTVNVTGTQITLGTDSPVWSIILLDVNEPVNFIAFDANFTSEPNAEGLLSVYWGEEHLGNVDERYVLDGIQNYSFQLPGIYQPNYYVLKLRVDSFSSTSTIVILDNISTGLGSAGYDYKLDGQINFLDFAEFSLYWTQIDCNNNNDWCVKKDLDKSGAVDINDLVIFAKHWLEGILPPLPGRASNPNPSNGAIQVRATADLSWTAGSDATSHNVYFGTSNPPPFIDNQIATIFDPGTMTYLTTYYWRIDEINRSGKTKGTIWSFTTVIPPPP